jgi:Na+-driven multidrug efflux pump
MVRVKSRLGHPQQRARPARVGASGAGYGAVRRYRARRMSSAPAPVSASVTAPVPTPRLFPLVWPLFLELLLGMGVGIAGTLLAARLGDTAAAAYAMAHHVAGMLFILFRVVGAGVGVVVAQALGGGAPQQASALARAALGASSWVGGVTALLTALLAVPLLHLLNTPPEVLPLALPLLLALAPTLLLDGWNASMSAVLRAHLRAREALAVTLLQHGLHLSLAVPLMQGVAGWPGLGLPGFALALLLARTAALVLHLHLWRTRLGVRPALRDFWRLPRAELAAMAHIGLPGAGEQIAYRLCFMVTVSAAGSMGAAAVATQAYAHQIIMLVLLGGLSLGLAMETVVGRLIGAGQLRQAHRRVRRALALGLAISVAVALAAALAGPTLLRLFTRDEAIVAAGAVLLWWTVLLEPGRTFNLVVINALRAAGDARYPVAVGAVSMVLVLAGGSWLLGVTLGLGLPGLWIAYAADEWLRGLLMWRRWQRLAWVPHARRARARLR